MAKFVLTMTFTVNVENSKDAYRLGEAIQNAVAVQIEDRELFDALEDSYLDYVEEMEEEEQ